MHVRSAPIRSALAIGAAAIVALLGAADASAAAAGWRDPHPAPPTDGAPACGRAADTGFPIRTRLYGGPDTYTPGGTARTFFLDLRNTTAGDCHQVHPLVLLVDRDRQLTPHRMSLRYAPPGTRSWRTVPFETTDHAENIGLPGGENGPGLTVPAGRTVTMRLRLRFAPGTPPDRVVVSATTMQRRGGGGAWVGESNHYAFAIGRPRPMLAETGLRHPSRVRDTGSAAFAMLLVGAALMAGARRGAPWRSRL
ncbi:hypothetical protein ABZ746_18600 [Streptomyces sp. NPDC020096]